MKWYLKVLKQYADFNGRARRKEYWMFTLVHTLILLGAVLIMAAISGIAESSGMDPSIIVMIFGGLIVVYALATFIPNLAVTARRLHDTNKSGWLMLLYIIPFVSLVLLVFCIIEGDSGSNEYGENPKSLGVE